MALPVAVASDVDNMVVSAVVDEGGACATDSKSGQMRDAGDESIPAAAAAGTAAAGTTSSKARRRTKRIAPRATGGDSDDDDDDPSSPSSPHPLPPIVSDIENDVCAICHNQLMMPCKSHQSVRSFFSPRAFPVQDCAPIE